MVETHKNLEAMFNKDQIEFRGFTSLDLPGEKYLQNSYLSSDPLLAQELVSMKDLDVMLLLDVNYAFSFMELIQLRRRKNLPVIGLIHDIIPIAHPEWFYGDHEWNKKVFREFLQKTLAVTDHLVVISEKVKRDIENLGWKVNATIHKIPLGAAHISPVKERKQEKIPTLIYLSTIEPRKGHLDLLGAFEILRAQGEEIRLVLVGRPGWLFGNIVERIKNNPDFGTYLFWESSLSDEGLAQVYNTTTLAVVPSLDEGFGLSIEESLARELVVLARKIPVFEERPNPNLYFFDGGAPELAVAILETIEKKWKPLPANGIRTMKDFAIDLKGLIESV